MRDVKAAPAASLAQSTGTEVLDRVIGIAPSPLLPGEAEADYVGVAQRIVAVARPKDAIEEFLTRDVVDLTWDILRLRGLKAGLLRASGSSGIANVMSSLGYDERKGYGAAKELGARWASGEKIARDEVAAALKKAELSIEDVMAKTLESKIETFERIDRMLGAPRHVATTLCVRLIVTAKHLALQCAERSTKLRTRSFATSKLAK